MSNLADFGGRDEPAVVRRVSGFSGLGLFMLYVDVIECERIFLLLMSLAAGH